MEAEKLGAKIFENTEAMQLIYEHEVTVLTNYQIPITCNKIICTTGYDTALFTSKKLCDKFASYSIVTNHLPDFSWYHNALLQDNADPYHYIRMLPDNRIILGGEDTPFAGSKINDKTARKKYDLLYDYLIQLFPELKNKAKAEFEFCGCFSATLNNVGLVGQDEDNPQILYNLGYGANGIVNSFVGADMICKQLHGKTVPFSHLFAPNRKIV